LNLTLEFQNSIRGRRAGFLSEVAAVAERALRSIRRDPESVIPALIIPVFFFVINIGALQELAETIPGMDFKAFQLPVAIVFAVTSVSRVVTLVTDIQTGYFDKLSLTPVNRLALLLGLMVADFTLVVALTIPVVILGLAIGVRFETGPLGVLAFILIGGIWGLVYTGFPYAIALKTGNPAAVNTSFLLFFPFMFLTTTFLPKEALAGWLETVATYNPVTYLLDALRSLITGGWDGERLLYGFISISAVGLLSMTLAFSALRGRVRKR
jgi:ABC-2 type transport system permease protein